MRLSKAFLFTQKEYPHDAASASHELFVRAGYIYPFSAGIYAYLPLMWRVIRKIEQIIREEMDKRGGIELNLPILQPKVIWEESGRWSRYLDAKFLFHLTDRRNEDLCLAPTAEEAMADIVRSRLRSYRDLPLILYQIGPKFRDELRPRAGIVRIREFIMKDGYSFDVDEVGMRASFSVVKEAYQEIFSRCGIDVKGIEADAGDIGGVFSTEFMALTPSGEDTVFSCPVCAYAANIEKATSIIGELPVTKPSPLEKYDIPGVTAISQIADFFNVLPTSRILKTILYRAGNKVVAVLIRGDLEVNERKIEGLLNDSYFEPIDAGAIKALTGGEVGLSIPIGLSGVTVIADESIQTMSNFVCGANETDCYFANVNFGRDLPWPDKFVDVRNTQEGDTCSRCRQGRLQVSRGIELGHIFQLGLRYSKAMNLTYLGKDGLPKHVMMGSYGIGVPRIAAVAVEQLHDDKGIVWPEAIAPYHLIITPVSWNDPIQRDLAEEVYRTLLDKGEEVILDDRDELGGFNFEDADLLGIPWRVTVGRTAKDRLVEIKNRSTGRVDIIPVGEVGQTRKSI